MPGSPGRWQLSASVDSGLGAVAAMLQRIELMGDVYCVYYVLQAVILVGLILRLIMHLTFQSRLSVIGGTLVGEIL